MSDIKLTLRAPFATSTHEQRREFLIDTDAMTIREIHADRSHKPYATTVIGEDPGVEVEVSIAPFRERAMPDLREGHT